VVNEGPIGYHPASGFPQMMHYWPFWLGGSLLAAIMVLHWLLVRRLMGVSGRFTAIVDALRSQQTPGDSMGDAEYLAALEAATRAEFGEEALVQPAEDQGAERVGGQAVVAVPTGPQPLAAQFLFLGCLVFGGFLSALSDGRFAVTLGLRSELVTRFFGDRLVGQVGVMVLGGMLVGFGTRMAGGCTSGHGLCGVSRFQPGSITATASFFLFGVVTAFCLHGLLR
jgi:uncharacterized membrane protein YedE/YeeE